MYSNLPSWLQYRFKKLTPLLSFQMHIYYCFCFIEFFVLFHHQTPFVRQNTPHPKELKAKAHKLFGKGKASDGKAVTEQVVSESL